MSLRTDSTKAMWHSHNSKGAGDSRPANERGSIDHFKSSISSRLFTRFSDWALELDAHDSVDTPFSIAEFSYRFLTSSKHPAATRSCLELKAASSLSLAKDLSRREEQKVANLRGWRISEAEGAYELAVDMSAIIKRKDGDLPATFQIQSRFNSFEAKQIYYLFEATGNSSIPLFLHAASAADLCRAVPVVIQHCKIGLERFRSEEIASLGNINDVVSTFHLELKKDRTLSLRYQSKIPRKSSPIISSELNAFAQVCADLGWSWDLLAAIDRST